MLFQLVAAKQSKNPTAKTPAEGENGDPETDAGDDFELELCWCIRQLAIELRKPDVQKSRKASELEKSLRILQNPKNPLPKKRMTMRMSLGDYRAKMKKDKEFAKEREAGKCGGGSSMSIRPGLLIRHSFRCSVTYSEPDRI